MGEKPRRLFAEAALSWAKEVGQHRKGWDRDWYRLRHLIDELGDDGTTEIDTKRIETAIPATAQSAASRNHYRSLVRSILRNEHQNGDLAAVPGIRMQPVSNERVRFLADWTEAERLIAGMPEHWRDPARFSLLTGVRQGTLRAIRREWIHGDLLIIPGADMKAGTQLPIPLDDAAMTIVRRQAPGVRLFTRPDRKGLGRMEHKVWRKVLERSKISDFRWHDLRHTWASWMVMSGKVSLYELQKLGGWKTPVMVQRYAHLAPDYLRDVVNRAAAHRLRSDPAAPGIDLDYPGASKSKRSASN